MKIKCLKDYPLTCLVKHFDKVDLVPKRDVPKEWLDLEIVHTYIHEFSNGDKCRVVVVK